MEESWGFLGSSGGSIRVMNSTKVRAPFSFYGSLATVRGLLCRRWRNVRVRGLFRPSGSNGRVKGLLGVQWWQHQSNHKSPEVRAPFLFYSVMLPLGDFFCNPLEKCKSQSAF